jgi:glutamine cyclotransferase
VFYHKTLTILKGQLAYFCFKHTPMKYILGIILSCTFITACKNNNSSTEETTNNPSTVASPQPIAYNIVNTFPHDTSSFTQGLQWYDNTLYEGTGNFGKSKLMKVDLKTGNPTGQVKLKDVYFGEGITILKDTLYQITWQQKTCFVYDAKTLKQIKTLSYETDGWGITNDGTHLIMSDGSNNIYYRDPATFKTLKIVGVTDNNGPVANINELEFVDGFIYANIWETNYIIKIDPANGHVVGRMDLTGVLEQAAKQSPDPYTKGNVLNGIAYDAAKKSFYITGKLWPVLFEVKLQ